MMNTQLAKTTLLVKNGLKYLNCDNVIQVDIFYLKYGGFQNWECKAPKNVFLDLQKYLLNP